MTEVGIDQQTLSPPGQTGYYFWDASDGKGILSLGLGAGPPPGTVIQLKYTAIYPFTVTASTGMSPVVEVQIRDEKELILASAQAKAAGALAGLHQTPREATITTLEKGWLPAQALTVTHTPKNITAATFTITQVEARLTEFFDTATPGAAGRRMWVYTLTATESTVYQGSYLDQARQLFSGGGSSTTALASISSGVNSGPALITEEGITVKASQGTPIPKYGYSFSYWDVFPANAELTDFQSGLLAFMIFGDFGLPNTAVLQVGAEHTGALPGAADTRLFASTDTLYAGIGISANFAGDGQSKIALQATHEIAISRGLKFPDVGVPSTNPVTLDAYYEFDWTPDVRVNDSAAGITYSYRTGSAQKVGNRMHVEGQVILTSKGAGSGAITILGLPAGGFEPVRDVVGQPLDIVFGGSSSIVSTAFVVMGAGVMTIYLVYHNPTTGNRVQLAAADVTDIFAFRFAITYQTAV